MKIIAKGFQGIALKKSATIVRKYHASERQWRDEIDNLIYLGNIPNLDIGCTIPRLYDSGSEVKVIDGKSYSYWTEMELIPGKTAHELVIRTNTGDPMLIGRSIGTVLFKMHNAPKSVADDYDRLMTKNSDRLLRHILNDKIAKIIHVDKDPVRLAMVQEAADYLSLHAQTISQQSVLSHQDLNMQNIIINDDQTVEGLVDWPSFGKTHPSLALYQLAKEDAWPYIEMRYEELGGSIRKDIMYAAATIHLAWSSACVSGRISQVFNLQLQRYRICDSWIASDSCWLAFTLLRQSASPAVCTYSVLHS